ncbi:hypothetical protein RHSIM_RhsimUnG0055700 [Rhododendron simsii]|uniref:Uncharacterized protein n=1 Tax=Rhododendron simsii TaxID=118357 RepID=A0A834FYT6_RHOSS|nr:hypothetical protein RHSIM_RhsimUnG0055700 [Rhododendron simsii]
MTALLLRRSLSLKEMRAQLVVQRIPSMLQSKRSCEKRFLALSMAVSFQDALASTCPHFVKFYGYAAFEWKIAGDFEDWLSSIVNARPRFIQPFYHSVNALPVLPTTLVVLVTTAVDYTGRVSIYFVPPDAVVITHSGARFFHVKLKNDELTVGWDRVAFAHNLGRNYILMFGLVGHLQFDLFVFDEEGCDISYDWSTTLPIHQVNALIGWDAELAMSNANASMALTACPPSSFRASRHALRCNLLLSSSDLERLVRLNYVINSENSIRIYVFKYSLTSEGSVASLRIVLLLLSVVMSGYFLSLMNTLMS